MQKILAVLALVIFVSGCESFGKGVAQAIIENNSAEDKKICEISGDSFFGIEDYLSQGDIVKVMMIHGVGSHVPGYSSRIKENLARSLNLTTWSKEDKNLTLVSPHDKKTNIGNLRVTRMQSEDEKKTVIFYELNWSNITDEAKRVLDYDTSGTYTYKRAAFNNTMKTFLNDVLPDPMMYLVDDKTQILNATKEATCWMLSRSWEDLEDNDTSLCQVSSYNQIKDLSKENIIFITHSLGSRILLDSVSGVADEIATIKTLPPSNKENRHEAEQIIDLLKQKEITVFMLANQLPLLQIGRPAPKVTNQIKNYCTAKGKKNQDRVFKETKIIAFSDPNDLLSYGITQDFVNNYIDSRICPSVTNIDINIADIISAFGVGVVNPVTAHTEYDNDPRVIEIISKGIANIKEDPYLNKKCTFRYLKN